MRERTERREGTEEERTHGTCASILARVRHTIINVSVTGCASETCITITLKAWGRISFLDRDRGKRERWRREEQSLLQALVVN